MKTKIVIFSINQEDAENKMNELYDSKQYRIVKRTKNSIETHFEHVEAMMWSQNKRATKAHELYVDSRIDEEMIKMYILHCVVPKRETWGNNEIVNYRWRDHVHYF